VSVLGEVRRIGNGLVVFVGVSDDDDYQDSSYLVNKIVNLRIFSDSEGRFDLSAVDTQAQLLVISQFTLYGDTRKGRRPSFTGAAAPEKAKAIFEKTLELFKETGLTVETGQFQQSMLVDLQNDGPVTIILDSGDKNWPRRV
jgi:D-tyrosyl-tRNA(Tyr) deacylase